ncbi:hypothetical protein [Paenibacillus favisporus]|uniref:hypothetical protein n=1 Tax=Paenibacillus favisporus TaxID=221028 RepID=UPI003D2B2FF4
MSWLKEALMPFHELAQRGADISRFAEAKQREKLPRTVAEKLKPAPMPDHSSDRCCLQIS